MQRPGQLAINGRGNQREAVDTATECAAQRRKPVIFQQLELVTPAFAVFVKDGRQQCVEDDEQIGIRVMRQIGQLFRAGRDR